jgi:hypothetical protein
MSAHPLRITRLPLDGLSWASIYKDFPKNLSRKFSFHQNLVRITVLYTQTDVHFLWHLSEFLMTSVRIFDDVPEYLMTSVRIFYDMSEFFMTCQNIWWHLSEFFLRMRNVAGNNFTENQNTHFIFNNIFYRKSFRLWDNVEKYGRAAQATDDSMAHAHCVLDNQGYKHTHTQYVILFTFPQQQR